MLFDVNDQGEIVVIGSFGGTTPRYTLNYKKYFVADFNMYGREYVSKKYGIMWSVTISTKVIEYKKEIETSEFQSLCEFIETLSEPEQLVFLKEIKTALKQGDCFEICKKYKFRYSSTIKYHIKKLCYKFGIEFSEKTVNQYSEQVRKDILELCKIYNKTAVRNQLMEKYNIGKRGAAHLIKSAMENENQGVIVVDRHEFTPDEKMALINDFDEFGAEYVMKKYMYNKRSALVKRVYEIKNELGLPTKHRNNFSEEEKIHILNEYVEHGIEFIMNKYGYEENSVRTTMKEYRKELGVTLKRPQKQIYDDRKTQYIKDYEEHGLAYVMEKYNYTEKTAIGKVSKYRIELGLPAPGVTDEFKREVIEYYSNNGRKATLNKYQIGSTTLYRWTNQQSPSRDKKRIYRR